jgi:3-phenylpropionate/trans-cinnamate dioxygenase ferredoxin subunit
MVETFERACAERELEEGKIKTVDIKDRPIAVARFEGKVFAIDNICTHDGGHLGEGNVIKGQIQCPRHGARFDLASGQVTRMPAVFGINTYEVKIEDGQIYVAVPE